jgi:hypothetical protein
VCDSALVFLTFALNARLCASVCVCVRAKLHSGGAPPPFPMYDPTSGLCGFGVFREQSVNVTTTASKQKKQAISAGAAWTDASHVSPPGHVQSHSAGLWGSTSRRSVSSLRTPTSCTGAPTGARRP